MGWVAEFLIQGFWESLVEAAYRKWGWVGGMVAFAAPFLLIGLIIAVALWS
ncbi:hypothetical protein [Sphingomonas sp. Root241]|uniref:hypothetical protein n=1 Tax=Sphingomonas sp. Root241 TaxID=1736501 RepID=UPI0012E34924|nr:hypothetical protein [Sphingomonas sp. Root241]